MLKPITLNRYVFHSLRKLLSTWVRPTVENNSTEALGLKPGKPVVYVMHQRSLTDLLVLESACIKAGLPRPYHAIDANHPEKKSHFFLSQHEGLILQRERPEPPELLENLVSQVESQQDDIQLVPVTILWGRSPEKEQSAFKLLFDWNFSLGGRFRKFLATLLHGRQTMVYFSPALSLQEIVGDSDNVSRSVRKVNRILRVHFRQKKASVLGPDLSHRRQLVNTLIGTPKIKKAIAAEAAAQEITLVEAESKARKYANEIASDFSMPAIRFLDILLTWFWNKLYSGVKVSHVEPLKKLAQTHTVVYVPCHRSHIDYLLLSYVLFYEGLPPPHIAAGINLNMPVVGTILRKCGAFFMRRTFRGNPLYSTVFHEYMYTLTSKGFATEYFIEGGRSRTGRTLTPKTGMLSITVRSYLRDNRKPLAFVPVYIGYEKLLEMASYLGELRGEAKKKESPFDIVRTLAALRNEFGKAWITFGEAIDLNSFLDQQAPHWRDSSLPEEKPEWLIKATGNLGDLIASKINSAAVINPVNLVATALLSSPRHALGEEELIRQLDAYTRLLSMVPYSDKTTMTELDARSMVHYVEKLQLVTRQTDALGDIISMDEKTAISMTYYRNNVLHMFAIPSLISCFFVNHADIAGKDLLRICRILYPYLKAELYLQWTEEEIEAVVQQWLDCMVDEGLITCTEDNGERYYHQPDPASSEYIMLNVMSRAIMQTLERFYMVISLLLRNGSGNIEAEALEHQSGVLAQRLSIIHGLNAPEFFDKALFRSFITQLQLHGVLNITQTNKLVFDDNVQKVANQAHMLLTTEIRHSIDQTSRHGVSNSSETVASQG
ncbi:glycerol-3-phosphate 1-O-acyltransferase PlsB [uncultured Endozoicomonas sp.]|uniref:glycerol-3-phosphate 1-O-acyltransferase PlsB n=1 Tax=uncultured Endozoicomonas sp. TaxID=432652 RepID=UPI00261CA6F2|nr:glycerol-3-phosphate 1-O-acyltransferase PlsB [uncultured Endozoicomonas sp.]